MGIDNFFEGKDDFIVDIDCKITEKEFWELRYFIPILMNEGQKDTFGASCGCSFFTAVAMRREDGSDYTLLRPATKAEEQDMLGWDDEDE